MQHPFMLQRQGRKITVVDRDIVNEPDLNRQVLYTPEDIGKKKAKTCEEKLHKFNPEIECVGMCKEINEKLLKDLVPRHDIVMDLCDNYPTRIKIAEACQKYNKKCVVAAVNGLEGFVMVTTRFHVLDAFIRRSKASKSSKGFGSCGRNMGSGRHTLHTAYVMLERLSCTVLI